MPDFHRLDQKFRLTPWSLKEHAGYVAGTYGSLLGQDAMKAAEYVEGYKKAEAAFDSAYELQRQLLRNSMHNEGEKPQELLDPVKMEWDPTKTLEEAVREVKEETKTEEIEKPKTRKPRKA